ncbi:hypothetical protein QYF61_009014 [Mycteria americana]|uniref:Uncharacterized protein n=1 Tax=Mycteria americana TaxID=33587 RepID=A0AAN7NFV1_MYCAM|nr:hypothetical protein QYF61_009014 [Mycteria americana]
MPTTDFSFFGGPLEEKWNGPYRVLLTTFTAIKMKEQTPRTHYSRTKKASEPRWTVESERVERSFDRQDCGRSRNLEFDGIERETYSPTKRDASRNTSVGWPPTDLANYPTGIGGCVATVSAESDSLQDGRERRFLRCSRNSAEMYGDRKRNEIRHRVETGSFTRIVVLFCSLSLCKDSFSYLLSRVDGRTFPVTSYPIGLNRPRASSFGFLIKSQIIGTRDLCAEEKQQRTSLTRSSCNIPRPKEDL